ncbi:hypothetical protein [Methanosarcina horonobensis]|uniref:hypothetical protein n=1 Tax=Methanosarcina horonobensis TaxID=418008 RepID=UPI000B2AA8CC|nr:hypothetical protein [Methanosarcina horonobensis]
MMSGRNISGLRELHGIGERVAGRLVEHFGSEDAALQAILEGDIASLSEVNGVSHTFALSLARDVRARAEGCAISDFLKTKEALDLYSRLLELIKTFAHTSHARDKLDLFFIHSQRPAWTLLKRGGLLWQSIWN